MEREEREGETTGNLETTCSFSGGTVYKAYGGGLDLPWGGVTVWQIFSEVEFGLRQLSGERAYARS